MALSHFSGTLAGYLYRGAKLSGSFICGGRIDVSPASGGEIASFSVVAICWQVCRALVVDDFTFLVFSVRFLVGEEVSKWACGMWLNVE